MKKLLCALLLLVPPAAYAAGELVGHSYKKLPSTLISAVALNATAATRTLTVAEQNTKGYGVLVLFVDHTNSAATDVQMTCNGSDDQGTTSFAIQSCDVSAGDCTSTDANWTKAVSANDTWVWRIDLLGIQYITCVFSGTSAGGSDTITVTGYVTAK